VGRYDEYTNVSDARLSGHETGTRARAITKMRRGNENSDGWTGLGMQERQGRTDEGGPMIYNDVGDIGRGA
jgi:hypothetical protein